MIERSIKSIRASKDYCIYLYESSYGNVFVVIELCNPFPLASGATEIEYWVDEEGDPWGISLPLESWRE